MKVIILLCSMIATPVLANTWQDLAGRYFLKDMSGNCAMRTIRLAYVMMISGIPFNIVSGRRKDNSGRYIYHIWIRELGGNDIDPALYNRKTKKYNVMASIPINQQDTAGNHWLFQYYEQAKSGGFKLYYSDIPKRWRLI